MECHALTPVGQGGAKQSIPQSLDFAGILPDEKTTQVVFND